MYKRKIKKTRLGFIIVLAFTIYFASTFLSQQRLFYANEKEMDWLKEKIAQEKERQEELKRLKDIQESDEYVEKVAREKLGMVKEGERVYIDIND